MYFIEESGELSCREGSKILTINECTTACRELGKGTGLLKNGKACYISGNGKKCRQDGRRTSKTSLVCVRKGNMNIWTSIRDKGDLKIYRMCEILIHSMYLIVVTIPIHYRCRCTILYWAEGRRLR